MDLPTLPDQLDIDDAILSPIGDDEISGLPNVDIKTAEIQNDWNFGDEVSADIEDYIDGRDYGRALRLAYLNDDHQSAVRAIDAAVSHDEQSVRYYDAYELISILDRTYLFEAYALEKSGYSERALRYYSRYLDILRIFPFQATSQDRINLERRLSLVRVKIYQLRAGMNGSTPFIDRNVLSFFSAFDQNWPYRLYLEEISSAGTSGEGIVGGDARLEFFDRCLEFAVAERRGFEQRESTQSCGATEYRAEHGEDFLYLFLLFGDIHTSLTRPTQANDSNGSSSAISQILSFRNQVNRVDGLATFLIDDLVADFLEARVEREDGSYGRAWEISEDQVQQIVCNLNLASASERRTFDRIDDITREIEARGFSC